MENNKINYKLLNILLVILIICLLYWISGLWIGIFEKIIAIIFPFLLAFAVAYALYPFSKKIINLGIPKWLSIGIIYFILIGSIILIGIVVVPMFYDQVVLFLSNISAVITDISSKYEIDLGVIQTSFSEISKDLLKDIGSHISDGAITIVNTSISVITNLIIVVIVSVYFLYDMEDIRKNIKKKLKSKKNRSYNYIKRLDCEVNNYFSGLLKNILIQFFEYTIVFFLIGHPNYLILGILAAVTTIIPYFGGLITNILAIIMASVVSVPLVIATIVICLIFPQVDGYFISPKVYGKTNDINPLITIMVVSAGGTLAGMGGIVVALPCYLFVRTTYKFFEKDLEKGLDKVKEAI